MSKHTPGPWKVGDRLHIWGKDLVGCAAAENLSKPTSEELANAQLIAAAPALYEALKKIVHVCKVRFDSPSMNGALKQAQAALALVERAEGVEKP